MEQKANWSGKDGKETKSKVYDLGDQLANISIRQKREY